MAKAPTPHVDGFCRCGASRGEHIGDKPCNYGKPNNARTLADLPIARWAYINDMRDTHR